MHLLVSMESIIISLEFKCVSCAIDFRLKFLGVRKMRKQTRGWFKPISLPHSLPFPLQSCSSLYALSIALGLLRHGLGYSDASGKWKIIPTLLWASVSKHSSLESLLPPSGLCEALTHLSKMNACGSQAHPGTGCLQLTEPHVQCSHKSGHTVEGICCGCLGEEGRQAARGGLLSVKWRADTVQ